MKLSIIIPVAPRDLTWMELLHQLRHADKLTEIILASPCQKTLRKIRKDDNFTDRCQAISAKAGRAQCMNAGAKKAKGDYFWFLHADSSVNSKTLQKVDTIIRKHRNGIWYFNLRFLDDGPPNMSINTLGVYIRSHWLKIPFGDQAFLMKKEVFEKIGPYDESVEYGEDHMLIWQAYQQGVKVKPAHATIKTSARKYHLEGRYPTTKKHLRLTWEQAKPEFIRYLKTKGNISKRDD